MHVWLPKESRAGGRPLPVADRTRAEIDRYNALRYYGREEGISHQIPRIAGREIAGHHPEEFKLIARSEWCLRRIVTALTRRSTTFLTSIRP